MTKYSKIGFDLISRILGGFILGYIIDSQLGIFPIFTLIMILFSLFLTLRRLYVLATKDERE